MGDTTKRTAALNEKFGIKDHLRFEETPEGLTKIVIATPKVSAQMYTQGAHLTQWDVAGHKPGLFVSGRSEFAVGKPIRGGVPVLFPWFGPRSDGKEGPMHGFARIEEWTVDSTHVAADESVQVVLSLGPTEQSRQLGFDHFHLAIQFTLGTELHITLEVTNHGAAPLVFEEGLHSYFAVGDATRVTVDGLEGTKYIDKRDEFKIKTQTTKLLTLTRDVDQVHMDTTTKCVIDDPAWQRKIAVAKKGSNTTVVWNPWSVLAPTIKDMDPDGWKHFTCVEAVNAGENKVTLQPGATHRLDCTATLL